MKLKFLHLHTCAMGFSSHTCLLVHLAKIGRISSAAILEDLCGNHQSIANRHIVRVE